ncbi:heterokaryon incompatibility protein Het-C-domain-containing protein [Exophiala viscosa]|uniref:Heterokaryon incompatibility protein Het-C-domain-containing protein n=1 Tax=Exophiala viscosa TaxID=2486360 RepID=A0AAN6I9X6_9EURO|nr:heterokaryon incompatibility protein Het-C-domain-containing protein [Exophiala viscosa]
MAVSSFGVILLCVVSIILLATPAHAFGAGNIGSTSKIEGQNWRHGDLEDTLLTIVAARAMGGKNFGKLDVKRVYFGNWLRDYSQAVDVGTVKHVSAEAIRILLWILGFMSFGYGSGEFEVTTQRLGCYRPEEHIDNPKDYADNEDARKYDKRLRGPVDERRELSIDPQTGLKNYIATEGLGIDTSAGLVRRLFGRSIELGRQYAHSKDKGDLYEALRLLGTASHCLEDYAAHSNYVELALIELGEREIFPHVGRRTQIQLREARHPVYPIVTGTFGGVDFLHSVCGEFDDKTTQSEIEEPEGTMQQFQNTNGNYSIVEDLLNKIPSGVLGGNDQAGKADELKQNSMNHQMQNSRISPRQPEEWTRYLNDVQKQIYPIIQWHDEILQSITETIEQIPILPDLIEQIQDAINEFVFSLLAPYVLPIINQVKKELNTGSSQIIKSSLDKQHVVFKDDNSSDPTHSMLSKDHFSNVLNEPAGKVARQVIEWVVPQIIACWDDERIDIGRTLNRIIQGVLHHPALRDHGQDGAGDGRQLMFRVVENWWRSKSEQERDSLREQLSRRGVENGKNHKPGVKDHGHGSHRPLGMANVNPNKPSSVASIAFNGGQNPRPSDLPIDQLSTMAGAAVGGGVLGSLVSGVASDLGSSLLGGGLDQNQSTYQHESYSQNGAFTQTITQLGQSPSGDRFGQAQFSRTTGPFGQQPHEEYDRFEQSEHGGHLQSQVHHEERTTTTYHEETR